MIILIIQYKRQIIIKKLNSDKKIHDVVSQLNLSTTFIINIDSKTFSSEQISGI